MPANADAQLATYQKRVNLASDYADRVKEAKSQFKRRNTKSNPAFRVVRATLKSMCKELVRCLYCEDSLADEVEHFKPKDLYPEVVFVWENYLYACGPCNGPKNNKFKVIPPSGTHLLDVTRPRKAKVVPPVDGDPALIDPRQEDPLKFLILDLRDTFEFTPVFNLSSIDEQRAEYTIEVLRLNERDYLPAARANAFFGFRARLREYINRRDDGADQLELARIIKGIAHAPHQTVWAEMKRQRNQYQVLNNLFAQAPEARRF